MSKKTGRPEFKVTSAAQKTVEAMVAYGIPERVIAGIVGCSEPTLRKHFSAEIDQAQSRANAKVAETLYQQAIAGNTTAMIFWLKCRAGWRERQELTGADGGPLQFEGVTRIERVVVDGRHGKNAKH